MRHVVAVLALLLASAVPALADGFIVVPPSPPEMPHLRNVPLWVKSHAVTVKVDARVAVTEVDEVFVNPNPRALEGTYLFPLPEGATIDRFSMWIDGKETPEYPLGITFAGRAWSEAKLLRLAYAYEQASNARRPPPGLPML